MRDIAIECPVVWESRSVTGAGGLGRLVVLQTCRRVAALAVVIHSAAMRGYGHVTELQGGEEAEEVEELHRGRLRKGVWSFYPCKSTSCVVWLAYYLQRRRRFEC
jgi:hypothetical protein